jgi:hypothetical protein
VARSALRYRSRKASKDAAAIERMRELSAQYPRYGYRRIRIFLGRDGHRMSEEARCGRSATAASALRAEPSLVLRLRVRPLRQRSAAQVSHRGGLTLPLELIQDELESGR